MALVDHWPLFGLKVRTERLELRVPSDDDLGELVEVARVGIHTPETMPFAVPWTDLESPEFERSMLQYHWAARSTFRADRWDLGMAIVFDGRTIGMQGLHAVDFPLLRTVKTGSWLGRAFQGRGIGTEMRAAAIRFAFEHLGAETITSGAFEDNIASQRVSLANGYEPNGVVTTVRRGSPATTRKYRLTRERWEATRLDVPITVEGLEGCLPLLGVTA